MVFNCDVFELLTISSKGTGPVASLSAGQVRKNSHGNLCHTAAELAHGM